MRHTNTGVVEFNIAASALFTDVWPYAMSAYGIAHEMQPCTNRRGMQPLSVDSLALDAKTKIQSTIAAIKSRATTPVSGGIVVCEIFVRA